MRYIRIKVKHLIGFVIASCIVAVGVSFSFPEMYLLIGNTLGNMLGKNTGNAYYSKLVEEYPEEKESVLGQIKCLESILFKDDSTRVFNRIITAQGGLKTTNAYNRVLDKTSIQNINTIYDSLLTLHGEKEYFETYTLYTALVNWYAGYNSRAIQLLSESHFTNSEIIMLRNLYITIMHIELGDFEKVSNSIREYYHEDYDFYWNTVSSYYSLMSGRQDSIEIYDKNALLIREKNFKIINQLYNEIKDIKININEKTSENSVQGRILYDGKPVKNMLIYITVVNGISSGGLESIYDTGYYVTTTNDAGEYSLTDISDGDFEIGIMASWNRLNGKNIEFDDQAYYNNIKLRGSNTYTSNINLYSPIKVDIKKLDTNQYQFIVSHDYLTFEYYNVSLALIEGDENATYNAGYYSEKYYDNIIQFNIDEQIKHGFHMGSSSSDGIINVHSLIDPLYYSGKYVLTIYGHFEDKFSWIDSYGTFSNQPNQIIEVVGNEWTEGDRLLLEKKFAQAVTQYEKEIIEDPNNIHVRKTLAKMYMKEWDSNDKQSNKDYKKALEHLLILNKSIPNSSSIRNAIAECYFTLQKFEKAIEYYDEKDDYERFYIGRCYYGMHLIEKALSIFETLLNSNHWHDDAIEKMIGIYLLQNNMEELSRVIKLYRYEHKYDYNQDNFVDLTNEFIQVDRRLFEPFYQLVKEGRIALAKDWLEAREDNLAKFYQLIFTWLDGGDYIVRTDNFMTIYEQLEEGILKRYAASLGYSEINNYNRLNNK